MKAYYSDLKNKHVLITGGTHGIGNAICNAFVQQGCKVSILDKDINIDKSLQKNKQVNVYQVNLLETNQLSKIINEITNYEPVIDILIPNAGLDPRYNNLDMSEEQWNDLFQLNMTHYFITCREILPLMVKNNKGNIIMTSSHTYMLAKPELIAYNSTKAAIVGFMKSLAEAYGKYNIRVNAVAPGWVMTKRQINQWVTKKSLSETVNEKQLLAIELTPKLIANLYLFLASDVSLPITRQVLMADAGQAKGC